MSETAPDWVMSMFAAINAVIALAYGLLAIFFMQRIKLPPKDTGGSRLLGPIAFGVLAVFFIGCTHTHLDLAVWSLSGGLQDHWYSWWNVLSHMLQAIGGIIFWVLATFYLQINIFDKRHYDKVTEVRDDERF